MMTLLSISTAAAIALLILSVSEAGGMPVSLSSTYYELGKDGWMFQALMATVALSLLPVWMSFSLEGFRWMVFLACASLLFVAAAPAFRMELEGAVHYTSAAVCCVFAVWWQVAEGLWDTVLLFAALGGMLSLAWRQQWCWLLECAVIGSLYANLIREMIVNF